MSEDAVQAGPWSEAGLAAALFAIDPHGMGGVLLHAGAGPVRDRWLAQLRALLPPETPWRRIPVHVSESRLLGGLDLAATLRAGRPVAERGLLAEADGGVAVLAMAERHEPGITGCLSAALDRHEVALERDGLALRVPARFGVVALDEGASAEERVDCALADRLGFVVDLEPVGLLEVEDAPCGPGDVARAREGLSRIEAGEEAVAALCAIAMELGVAPLRASLLAVRAARASAALGGRDRVAPEDVAAAVRLVLLPRATQVPRAPGEEAAAPPEPPSPEVGDESRGEPEPARGEVEPDQLADRMVAAAHAAVPAGLLEQLRPSPGRGPQGGAGRAGAHQASPRRGRPAGIRRGTPARGARLNLVETLRAAAPWQRVRGRDAEAGSTARVQVRSDDFRVTRFLQRRGTATVFVVDASGSSALNRLAEAKGAVELLLADCYVRRDQVALVGFRGRDAQLLLPPTRSLVRAKRSLAGLPGGGGTPLAAGIGAAAELAASLHRRGSTPVLVLLTDGKANVAADGSPGRARAREDALAAARQVRAAGFAALLVDTSPQPQEAAREVADAMGARYLALPHADAVAVSEAVRTARGT